MAVQSWVSEFWFCPRFSYLSYLPMYFFGHAMDLTLENQELKGQFRMLVHSP